MKQTCFLLMLGVVALIFIQCTPPVFMEEPEEASPTEDTGWHAVIEEATAYDTLSWQGETGKFRLTDNGTIRLNDSLRTGSACLYTPLRTPNRTGWVMQVNCSFNPSARNHARLYLMSTSADLNGPLNCYFLQIGGAKDCIYFYCQTGKKIRLLAQSEAFMRGNTSPKVRLHVQRDSLGYFDITYTTTESSDRHTLCFLRDTTVTSAAYSGILCIYTPGNSRKMSFPTFKIHHQVTDTQELKPVKYVPGKS